eukprot:TRINITY_DN6554_c0_g1_i2.p1 TRINITY_DN6554_c0_g1~~TRINITY_DN6554_c0_g1_i2.p1  ORF type:complete len:759 (-),score=193.06 TRINITY_DN6554_c0_g1_i2:147-2399(-)
MEIPKIHEFEISDALEEAERPISPKPIDSGATLSYHYYMQTLNQNALRRSSQNIAINYAHHGTDHDHDEVFDDTDEFQKLIITSTGKEYTEETKETAELLLEALHLRRKYYGSGVETKPTPTAPNSLRKCPPPPCEASSTAPFDPFNAPVLGPVKDSEIKDKDGVFYIEYKRHPRKDLSEEPHVSPPPSPRDPSAPTSPQNVPMTPDTNTADIYSNTWVPALGEFLRDMERMKKLISHGPAKTVCYTRLRLLESKFGLHCLLNGGQETAAAKEVPHRDFYNVRKVDTHIHHSSSMNQKHLLKFMKKTLRENGNDVVIHRDGADLTLSEVFKSLNLDSYCLSVDMLDVHADTNTFHRFDKFNLKYNPCGQSRLREIFLKTDNKIKGQYLAKLTHELFQDLEHSKYQYAEYRISIYGRSQQEWSRLGAWFYDHKLFSENVRWMIQIPRLYSDFKANNMVHSMGDLLTNIFLPLFEVTKDPSVDPKLHCLLQQITGFDCVDDESKPEKRFTIKFPPPKEWTGSYNPPYVYYCFYLWANISTLNWFRRSRGLNTFSFRPHSGEAGEIEHLGAAFMLADGISHGIMLRKAPVLQYLYYLTQIGIAMSPLSNNSLFLNYHRNPFPVFFARGMNVSLSTDDPLQFHYTKEPLIEEYSIAAQVWKLTQVDMCEIARNSVRQSGFEHPLKMHWLGESYLISGPKGNDLRKTNVPNIRIIFRYESLLEELKWILESVKRENSDSDFGPLHDLSPLIQGKI